jgi:hypothetical protein
LHATPLALPRDGPCRWRGASRLARAQSQNGKGMRRKFEDGLPQVFGANPPHVHRAALAAGSANQSDAAAVLESQRAS